MTPAPFVFPVELTLVTVAVWLVLGVAAIALQQRPQLLLRMIFPLTAVGGLGTVRRARSGFRFMAVP